MENIYNQHRSSYIYNNGQNKFDNLYRKVSESGKLAQLQGYSVQGGMIPSAGDFLIVATSLPGAFFGFNTEAKKMGALIALKIWDETVNRVYGIASTHEIHSKAMSIAGS